MRSAKAREALGTNLRPFLNRIFERYHSPSYLGSDPLSVVRKFHEPKDRELAALFGALLAYGNVKQINRSLENLFCRMGREPADFILNFNIEHATRVLSGYKHRFTDA